ncbi:hypothetical protein, partial [Streptomyces sp. NPDC002403]
PEDQADPNQTPHPDTPPPQTIEDLARTIRQLAGKRTGVHLRDLATHLGRDEAEIRNTLKANGITTVKKLPLRFGDERVIRLGVRVDALGRRGLAHLPPIEDLARTIRKLAAQHGWGVGVHLATLAAHLGRTEAEIRNVLKANGINVKTLQLWFDGERVVRLGVRVDALGRHGLAHFPTVEDLARTIRELASANDQPGVHLDDLTTHLRSLQELEHLDLQKNEIRGALEAAGIDIQRIELWVGDERRDRLGVRVDALGQHSRSDGDGARGEPGELPPDASDEPGRTGPQEAMAPAGPGRGHHPTSPSLAIEDLARTIRRMAAQHGRRVGVGVYLGDLAAHLGRTEAEIRGVLEANGISVKKLDLRFDGKPRDRLGVRVNALGGRGLAHLPPVEDLARTIRELAGERVGVYLRDLATHLSRDEFEVRGVLEAAGITVRSLELSFGGERRFWLGVRVDALGGRGLVGGGSGGLSR